jgi:hypothetical protein
MQPTEKKSVRSAITLAVILLVGCGDLHTVKIVEYNEKRNFTLFEDTVTKERFFKYGKWGKTDDEFAMDAIGRKTDL